jgi:hypothetical protein
MTPAPSRADTEAFKKIENTFYKSMRMWKSSLPYGVRPSHDTARLLQIFEEGLKIDRFIAENFGTRADLKDMTPNTKSGFKLFTLPKKFNVDKLLTLATIQPSTSGATIQPSTSDATIQPSTSGASGSSVSGASSSGASGASGDVKKDDSQQMEKAMEMENNVDEEAEEAIEFAMEWEKEKEKKEKKRKATESLIMSSERVPRKNPKYAD